MNRLVIKIEKLCGRMNSLEKKHDNLINSFHLKTTSSKHLFPPPSSLPNPLPNSQNYRTFASIISFPPNPNTKVIPPPSSSQQLPPIPKNSFINQFKMGQVTIRAKFGLPHPFHNLNPTDIASRVNAVLDDLDPKDLPFSITVRAVTKFPSGALGILNFSPRTV